VVLVAVGFEVSGGASEIVGSDCPGRSGSIVARFALSALLLGDGDPLKGSLSAFANGLSSSSMMGAAAAVWDVMGLAGVVLASMMVVQTTKRAPTKGAQSRTSQRILAIAKSLSASWQRPLSEDLC
jgi:hypothetical protein